MISSYALQVAALATVAVSLVPQGTQEQAEEVEIFSSPVKVEIEDSALPLLALEDVFFEAHDPIAEQTWKTLERTDGESLSAGSEVGKVFRGDKDSPMVKVEEPKIKKVTRKSKRTRAKILLEIGRAHV